MLEADLQREIAIVRDAGQEPGRRAFAAASLAAGNAAPPVSRGTDPALRMFGFAIRHDDALLWDGRASRSGTITYVDDECVEQYVGPLRWIAYRRGDFGGLAVAVGDQVRISARGGAVAVESIGPNRIESSATSAAREVTSGLVVFLTARIEAAEIEAYAQAVAERYGGTSHAEADTVRIDFRGGALLVVAPAAPDTVAASTAPALLTDPVTDTRRLEVQVRSNQLDAALDAERALVLLAALLVSEADAVAVDDTGAVFSSDGISSLGTRNEMRADDFSFAAAAAQRRWPAERTCVAEREGVCDELIVCFGRPWRADFAARFLARELAGLSEGAVANDDPIVPQNGELLSSDESAGSVPFGRLAALAYETVEIEIGFVDVAGLGAAVENSLGARRDVDVLLGRPVASAVVIAFGNRGPDMESDRFMLEMRRAETLATALAASFAARGESIATDAAGVLYSAPELSALALRRCGKSHSWNARAAAGSAAARRTQTAISSV